MKISRMLVILLLFSVLLVGSTIAIGTVFWKFEKEFADQFKNHLRQLPELVSTLGPTDISIWNGEITIQNTTLTRQKPNVKALIDIKEITLEFSPISVLWGPLRITEMSLPEGAAVINIIGSGSRIVVLNRALNEAFKQAKTNENPDMVIEQLTIGTGLLAIGPESLNTKPYRTIPIQASQVDLNAEGLTTHSVENQLRRILIELTDQALVATGYSLIK